MHICGLKFGHRLHVNQRHTAPVPWRVWRLGHTHGQRIHGTHPGCGHDRLRMSTDKQDSCMITRCTLLIAHHNCWRWQVLLAEVPMSPSKQVTSKWMTAPWIPAPKKIQRDAMASHCHEFQMRCHGCFKMTMSAHSDGEQEQQSQDQSLTCASRYSTYVASLPRDHVESSFFVWGLCAMFALHENARLSGHRNSATHRLSLRTEVTFQNGSCCRSVYHQFLTQQHAVRYLAAFLSCV